MFPLTSFLSSISLGPTLVISITGDPGIPQIAEVILSLVRLSDPTPKAYTSGSDGY